MYCTLCTFRGGVMVAQEILEATLSNSLVDRAFLYGLLMNTMPLANKDVVNV